MPDVHIVLLGTPLKLNTTYLVSSEVPFFLERIYMVTMAVAMERVRGSPKIRFG